jgi:hypothetical protein
MWLNDMDGDCVTAEEALKNACDRAFMFWPGVMQPSKEIFIADDTVLTWATANNVLNGAYLTQVMDLMQTAGFAQDGNLYNDGPYTSVDWTNAEVLQNAISKGPVKIGVAADQLENAVPNPPTNGWVATGFQTDQNEDHCVSLVGFGSIAWLAEQLNVRIPDGVNPIAPAYALFTWSSVGIIDVPSMLAITGEAWLRQPSTIVVPQTQRRAA